MKHPRLTDTEDLPDAGAFVGTPEAKEELFRVFDLDPEQWTKRLEKQNPSLLREWKRAREQ